VTGIGEAWRESSECVNSPTMCPTFSFRSSLRNSFTVKHGTPENRHYRVIGRPKMWLKLPHCATNYMSSGGKIWEKAVRRSFLKARENRLRNTNFTRVGRTIFRCLGDFRSSVSFPFLSFLSGVAPAFKKWRSVDEHKPCRRLVSMAPRFPANRKAAAPRSSPLPAAPRELAQHQHGNLQFLREALQSPRECSRPLPAGSQKRPPRGDELEIIHHQHRQSFVALIQPPCLGPQFSSTLIEPASSIHSGAEEMVPSASVMRRQSFLAQMTGGGICGHRSAPTERHQPCNSDSLDISRLKHGHRVSAPGWAMFFHQISAPAPFSSPPFPRRARGPESAARRAASQRSVYSSSV